MTLQQLTYFLAAVRCGSFSRAAAAQHIAQPSLSQQIRRLEAELGADLFVRTHRSLVLTAAGRRLVPEAERVLSATEHAVAAVREPQRLVGGTAEYGTFGSAHLYLLPDLIAALRTSNPHVTVRVVGQNSAQVADAVRGGDLEVGLVMLPIDARDLHVSPPLRTDEVGYVTLHAERVDRPVTIERLAAAPLILSQASWAGCDPVRRQLTERAQRAGVNVRPVIEVESAETALALAARDLGDTLASRPLLAGRDHAGRLLWGPFEEPLKESFAFITHRGSRVSPASRAFITAAREWFRDLASNGSSRPGPPSSRDGLASAAFGSRTASR